MLPTPNNRPDPRSGPRPGPPRKPTHARLLEQAVALLDQGKPAEALARVRSALQRRPTDPELASYLASLLLRTGEAQQALFYAQQANKAAPDNPLTVATLMSVLVAMRRVAEAQALGRKLIELEPNNPLGYAKLAELLDQTGQIDEAAEVCENGMSAIAGPAGGMTSAVPTNLRLQLAGLFHKLGRHDQARATLRQVQQSDPSNFDAAVQLAALSNYDAGSTPQQTAAAHFRAGMLLADTIGCGPAGIFQHPPRKPGTPPHAALLSPDLWRHSVGYFALPLARAIKQAGWRLSIYNTGHRHDDLTDEFNALADASHAVPALSSYDLARKIHEARVDVLFELSGLTDGHRQKVMALKPAPIQITAIGYPATTGNRAIDFRLVDASTDPPGSEGLCVEKPLRLEPTFLCYQPPASAPAPRQAITPDEPLVLGSFNAFQKLSSVTLDLWRQCLERLPHARLALKGAMVMGREAGDRLRRTIVDAGLPMDRVDLLATTVDRDEHLKMYHRVHIGLDTYPYHGTTTTCEALYMGVPVVTLAGEAHASRVGVSLLRAVGVPELIAKDQGDYVERVVAMAGDREKLGEYHAKLRDCMARSPLLDQGHYSRQIAQVLRAFAADRD